MLSLGVAITSVRQHHCPIQSILQISNACVSVYELIYLWLDTFELRVGYDSNKIKSVDVVTMTVSMTLTVPLTGILLISCVKSKSASSSAALAEICGYGDNIDQFENALHGACKALGLSVEEVGAMEGTTA
ncbi:MAG: hypothetical protein AAF959_24485 [Cyanobacteria bacterium P01_D01_bin.56]